MRLLWITNVSLNIFSNANGLPSSVYSSWLEFSSKLLSQKNEIELNVAFPMNDTDNVKIYEVDSIHFYPFKSLKGTKSNINKKDKNVSKILTDVNPDLVHIHGTEMRHSYVFAQLCNNLNIPYVVSIQGLMSVYANHVYSDLPRKVIKSKTLKDFIRKTSVQKLKETYEAKGELEQKLFLTCKYFIGRTSWDRAAVDIYSNNGIYFHNEEILREEFYSSEKWSYEKCEKKTIFFSQATNPIKGFHILLESLALIKDRFPNLKVYIAGTDISRKYRFKLSYYHRYILKRIKKLNLEENVLFVGELSAKEMIQYYLRSNLFISSSSIENSPNSVAEAMYLGVPTVSSYVGGIGDMINNKVDGIYYNFNSYHELSFLIDNIFKSKKFVMEMGKNAYSSFCNQYNYKTLINHLIDIYATVTDKETKYDKSI